MSRALSTSTLAELAEGINDDHRMANCAMSEALAFAQAAGDKLIQAKSQVKHGEWQKWVADNTDLSASRARAYKSIAANWSAIEAAGVGSIEAALTHIARPKRPRSGVFDTTWKRLEEDGCCDPSGSAEYEDVKSEWEKAGCPADAESFITRKVSMRIFRKADGPDELPSPDEAGAFYEREGIGGELRAKLECHAATIRILKATEPEKGNNVLLIADWVLPPDGHATIAHHPPSNVLFNVHHCGNGGLFYTVFGKAVGEQIDTHWTKHAVSGFAVRCGLNMVLDEVFGESFPEDGWNAGYREDEITKPGYFHWYTSDDELAWADDPDKWRRSNPFVGTNRT